MVDDIRRLQEELSTFEKSLGKLRAATVTRAALLLAAKQIVDDYFRGVRPQLLKHGVADQQLEPLDGGMHALLEQTHKRSPASAYKRLIKDLRSASVEAEKEVLATAGADKAAAVGDSTDSLIIQTLRKLIPNAALAYEQGLLDLAASARLSWRGPATDFREAMRETLDHLAPDAAVTAQNGFRLEPGMTGPTMKQKVRYVLRQREKSRAVIETAETAVDTVEGIVGSFVRSVYSRSSISTHTPTDRAEVVRIRSFVRVALCELLELHEG